MGDMSGQWLICCQTAGHPTGMTHASGLTRAQQPNRPWLVRFEKVIRFDFGISVHIFFKVMHLIQDVIFTTYLFLQIKNI